MTASNILVFKGDKEALKQQVISAGGLVCVDFHASWCPSCRRFAQMLPDIANAHPSVLFLKADVDDAKDLAATYLISSIPHIKFFRYNETTTNLDELGSVTGANKGLIIDELKKHTTA